MLVGGETNIYQSLQFIHGWENKSSSTELVGTIDILDIIALGRFVSQIILDLESLGRFQMIIQTIGGVLFVFKYWA